MVCKRFKTLKSRLYCVSVSVFSPQKSALRAFQLFFISSQNQVNIHLPPHDTQDTSLYYIKQPIKLLQEYRGMYRQGDVCLVLYFNKETKII